MVYWSSPRVQSTQTWTPWQCLICSDPSRPCFTKLGEYCIRFRYEDRVDSRLAPSQWETSLQSNDVSHWLGTNLESVLERFLGRCSSVPAVLISIIISWLIFSKMVAADTPLLAPKGAAWGVFCEFIIWCEFCLHRGRALCSRSCLNGWCHYRTPVHWPMALQKTNVLWNRL